MYAKRVEIYLHEEVCGLVSPEPHPTSANQEYKKKSISELTNQKSTIDKQDRYNV